MAYFDLDINPIIDHCKQRGDIKHVRFPVRDFDPFSLRQRLPEAVATLVKEAASGRGKLYIHCTAGDTCSGPTLVYQYRTCFRQMLWPMVYVVAASMISIQNQLGAYMAQCIYTVYTYLYPVHIVYYWTKSCWAQVCCMPNIPCRKHVMYIIHLANCTKKRYGIAA